MSEQTAVMQPARSQDVALLASCWTTAEDAAPQVGNERSPVDLQTRIETATRAGWTGFGLVHADVAAYRETHELSELAVILADNGMVHIELEFLGDWWTTGDRRARSDLIRRDLFEGAEQLGAQTVKIAPEIGAHPVDLDVFASEFDGLARQAVEYGTRVALEPMPFSANVKSVADGGELLQMIDNPGAGLCIDIWHVFRSGTEYEELTHVQRKHIFAVELDDGSSEPQGSLWSDTVDRRLYPGRGDFRVPEFIQAIRDTGYDGPWGVEIISAEHRGLPIARSLPVLAREVRACFRSTDDASALTSTKGR